MILDPIQFDRMIAKGSLKQLLFIILFLPILVAIVGWGCQFCLSKYGATYSFDCLNDNVFWDTYENYINPNAHPQYSFSHRLYMLLIGIFGVFLLNGILVSAFVSWVEKRSERWKSGELRYDKKRWFQRSFALDNYVVVIGGNEMVPELVRQILSADKEVPSYALIMTNRDVSNLRKRIASVLREDEKRVVIYYGERTLKEDLSHLQIERANKIYVIGEQLDIEQKGSHHDVKNMECVRLMASILKGIVSGKKECRVMFEYQSTFSVFQFTDINKDISEVLDFKPFNYYETWAQKVLICQKLKIDSDYTGYLPLEGMSPITPDSNEAVHLIIVGMSRMGIALGIEAAHIAHYPNFAKHNDKKLHTRITFIDTSAKKEMQFLQGHYKELFAVSRWHYLKADDQDIYYKSSSWACDTDFFWHDPLHDADSMSPYKSNDSYSLGEQITDIDWEFIEGDLEMPSIQDYIRYIAQKENIRATIAICLPKDNASFAASLYLPDEVYEKGSSIVQVLSYQPFGDAMCQSFVNRKKVEKGDPSAVSINFNLFGKLKAFGMMDSCYDVEQQKEMESAANLFGNVYMNTNKKPNKDANKKIIKIGKTLAAKQWSNVYAAAHLWTKLRNIEWDEKRKLDDATIDILKELEHIRWNTEQLLLGFAPLKPEEQNKMKSLIGSDEFIIKKEENKANMSHLDICSFDILQQLDKEAIKYDEEMTRILPQIYREIKSQ